MSKTINSIIFDLDGVICGTDEYHCQAWMALAERLNIPFDRQINKLLRGVSRMESLEIVLEKSACTYTQEEKAAFAAEKNKYYQEFLKKMTEQDLEESVRTTLELLRKRGFKLAIGSSSKNAKLILKQIGLEGFFDAVSDGTMITHSKPDPEVFLLAASMIKAKPCECVVVEDAVAGINAAQAAGMMAVGIAEEDTKKYADAYVSEFSKLSDLPFLQAIN